MYIVKGDPRAGAVNVCYVSVSHSGVSMCHFCRRDGRSIGQSFGHVGHTLPLKELDVLVEHR